MTGLSINFSTSEQESIVDLIDPAQDSTVRYKIIEACFADSQEEDSSSIIPVNHYSMQEVIDRMEQNITPWCIVKSQEDDNN